jgi:hypothetical protein
MQSSFTHPLLSKPSNQDKTKRPKVAKLFSGVDIVRDNHSLLNPKRRPRHSRIIAAPSFTLPYRSITMNHSNDKAPNAKRKKSSKIKNKKKKQNSQNKQPTQNINQAHSLHLSLALPSRTMAESPRNEPGISERRGIRWVCNITLPIDSSVSNSSQLPDEPRLEEPTSTLVLTSSRGEFVDIRISCTPGETLPNEGKLNILQF